MVGIITWFANYRAVPGSRTHLSNPEPNPGLTKAFSGILGRMLSLTKWKLGLYFLERLGLGEALGEAWKWILVSMSSYLY